MIIAGDIGGTKTVLALYALEAGNLKLIRQSVFPSKGPKSLEEILEKFLVDEKNLTIDAGCFGVAGAVIDGKCKTTNLPWELDEHKLADFLKAKKVKLLNDLEAAAFGMLFLNPTEKVHLNPDCKNGTSGNIAVIAAGTGLGEAILFWDGEKYHPSASEGGHCDFAPTNNLEIDLFLWLRQHYPDHVSYERILSGPGLFNIFRFLTETGVEKPTEALTLRLKAEPDSSAVVSQMALANSDPAAVATLNLFVSIYGKEASNLSLKCLGTGGVFIGGGIAPKILPFMNNGKFLEGFFAKGRFLGLMKSIPIQVALNPEAPLIGASNYATRLIHS
jgi:glucokinase